MSEVVTIDTPEGGLDVRPLWVSEPRTVYPGDTFDASFVWPGAAMLKNVDALGPTLLRWVLVEDGAS